MSAARGTGPANGLAEALEAMDQGFLWLDEQLIVRQHNQAYRRLLELDDAERFIGQPYQNLIRHLLSRGEFINAPDPKQFLTQHLHTLQAGTTRRFERVRPNGVILSISAIPLPSGGYVYTYLDVTAERHAQERLRRNAKATVVAMANFAEHRDTDTGAHVLRVARLAWQIARQLQRGGHFPAIVDERFIAHIGTSSILHDVGKIATPDRVLFKAGSLDNDEWDIIRQHPGAGALLLRQANLLLGDSDYLEMGIQIALGHHEWFDGSGYPAGLAGHEIPLAAQICAIADVFDALTSRRPYKAPWSIEAALTEIGQLAGRQFDPLLVRTLTDVIQAREQVQVVRWTPDMSVGNAHIDEQHSILIDTINQLAFADTENDRPVISMILDELVSYAAFHFQYEEQLMADSGYPGLAAHRGVHRDFAHWMADMRDEFTFQHRPQAGRKLLDYLSDWLRDHILVEDQRYREFLRGEPGT